MKRVHLEAHLRDRGCHFSHHGGKHDIWINPIMGKNATIPRHREIKKWTDRGICKVLGVDVPPGACFELETRKGAALKSDWEFTISARLLAMLEALHI